MQQAGAVRVAQTQDLALDRPQRHPRQAGDRAAPRTCRDDDVLGGDDPLARDLDAGELGARAVDPLDGLPRTHINPYAAGRLSEGGDRRAGVGCMVARNDQRQPDRRRERGLDPARGARHESLHSEVKLATQVELALERLGLVAVACDDKRPALPQPRIDARRLCELRGERRPRIGAAQPELEQRELAGVGLGDRREHPRRDVRRAAPELAALDDAYGVPALRCAPCDSEPDDPPADDDDVRSCGWVLRHCTSLRRHDPDQLLTVGVTPSQPALRGLP